MALLGLCNFLFNLAFAVFLFLCQRRQGQFFGGLVGILFCCLAFAFLRTIVELVPCLKLSNFASGLRRFLLELDFRSILLGFRSSCGRGGDRGNDKILLSSRGYIPASELCFRGLLLGFRIFLFF